MTMRESQSMVYTHRYGRPSLVCRVAGLLLALLAVAGSALAQFNGPALGLTSTVNRKVVPTTDPAILFPVSREILLGQGDVVTVRVYGPTSDYSPTVRVALDGTIQLPLIGGVSVDGLSMHQAEDLIARRLADAGMYRNPQVSIQLIESPNEIVTITGEMHGVFPVAGGKRLYDVLSLAGGLPATASHMVIINRPGIPEPIVVDLGTDPALSSLANVPIFPRDTIVISRVGVVYLLGAFKTQGAVPIQQDSALTLMELTALGGGAGWEGRFEDLRLIRTSGTTRTVVTLDLKKILRGQAPDPLLQADDIVFLPTNIYKAAIKNGGIPTLLGIASILIFAAGQQ
jgi:polysaccharide biosynthesis/export protein